MKYNRLGRSGLFVSQLALGTMTFGDNEGLPALGGLGQQEANLLVSKALEAGVNLFDTADSYADGASEQLLGEALRQLAVPRERYLIASKSFSAIGPGPNDAGTSRGHLLDGVKKSLRRLGVDYLDLYQLHGFDPATPVEESLRALDDLVRQGYVRYVGVSNWAAWQIAKALGISERLGITRFSALQAYYSIAGRDIEREISPLVESEGLGLLVWSPLAGGFLTGKKLRGVAGPQGTRSTSGPFPPVNEERGYRALDAIRPIADAHGGSVAQVALAWLLAQRSVSAVLVGAKSVAQLEENLKATTISLQEHEIAAIAQSSALPLEYPGWMLDMQGRDRKDLLENSNR
jgi:aryl-alcohol dehydrogenase-like predicted oxidoreductase